MCSKQCKIPISLSEARAISSSAFVPTASRYLPTSNRISWTDSGIGKTDALLAMKISMLCCAAFAILSGQKHLSQRPKG